MSTHVPEHVRTTDPAAAPARSAAPGQALGEAVLVLRDVGLEYPDGVRADGTPHTVRALDGVDLAACRGRVTALVGESGSGKSSLLSVAATLVRPDSGTVRVGGDDAGAMRESERARLRRERIGVVFQQPNLLASLTAVEQLLLTEHLRGLRGKELRARRQRAEDLLARVGLEGLGGRRVHQLSGGQRQRVNIARALMGEPALLLADEPTSALDHERSREILELLRSVTREFGVATVVVTHDSGLLDLVDDVVCLRDGRVVPG